MVGWQEQDNGDIVLSEQQDGHYSGLAPTGQLDGFSWHCIELYRPAAQVGRSIDDCTARSGGGAQMSMGQAPSSDIKQRVNDCPKDR